MSLGRDVCSVAVRGLRGRYWLGAVLLAVWLSVGACGAQAAGEVAVVDLLVVYTPAAREGAGGLAALEAQVSQAVVEANTVLQNSRVNGRIRLVGVSGMSYEESGSVATDLERLRAAQDGFMDEVHALRDQLGADLVCLVTETGEDWWFYGLQGPSAANAFSVIQRPFLVGGCYLPVALSFNFGCQTERPYADSQGAFPYAYGYSFGGTDEVYYSTVEAFAGQRLPFFSNPDIRFQGAGAGIPVGQPYACDNARVLNATAPMVAAFRGATNRTVPPSVRIVVPADGAILVVGGKVQLEATALAGDAPIARVDFWADGVCVGTVTNAPFGISWTSAEVSTHVVCATAADAGNVMTVSAPVRITVKPANDDFGAASRLEGTNVIVRTSNRTATAEAGEPSHAGAHGGHSLWWRWRSETNQLARIQVRQSTFEAVVAAYVGTNLNCLSTVSPTVESDGVSYEFRARAGTEYVFAVDSRTAGQAGEMVLELTGAVEPSNDDFANRSLLIGTSAVVEASTADASRETGEPVHGDPPGRHSLWWTWTSPAVGNIRVRVESRQGDWMLLGVYRGVALTDLAAAAQASGPSVEVVLHVAAGERLQIAVDRWELWSNDCSFALELNFEPASANDDLVNRRALTGADVATVVPFSGVSLEPGEPFSCWGWQPPAGSLWWSWDAPASGMVTLSSTGTVCLVVYEGDALTNLQPVVQGPPATFLATGGKRYLIQGAATGRELDFRLTLSTVQIVTPADGTVVHPGQAISIDIITSPSDGTSNTVTIFADGVMLASLSTAPFSCVWTNASLGVHTVTAQAVDPQGTMRPSPPVSVQVRPLNDDFAEASALVANGPPAAGSNVGAVSEPGEPGAANSVWWYWRAVERGRAQLKAVGTRLSPVLSVYRGATLSNLVSEAVFYCGNYETTTIGEFSVEPGATYWIAVTGGGWQTEGTVELSLSFAPSPANDRFSDRALLEGDSLVLTNNLGASGAELEEPGYSLTAKSSWWAWTATHSSQVTLVGTGSCGSMTLGVYTGDSWSNLVEVVSGVGTVRFQATAGTTYQLVQRVEGCQDVKAVALFRLEAGVPENDDFSHPTVIAGVPLTVSGNALNATAEPGEPGWLLTRRTLWWAWTAPATGLLTLSTTGSSARPMVAIFSGTELTNLALLGGNMNMQNYLSPPAESIQFKVRAGQSYLIAADEADEVGLITLNFSGIASVPPNDDFADRSPLRGGAAVMHVVTTNATREEGEPVSRYGHTVWWTWTAPSSGAVDMWCDRGYGAISVFSGSSLSNLNRLAEMVGSTALFFSASAGSNYVIRFDGGADDNCLYLQEWGGPGNDNFANRALLEGTNVTAGGPAFGSSHEPGEPAAHAAGKGSLWWSWRAPGNGCLTLSVLSGFNPIWGVYVGDSITNLVPVASGPGACLRLAVRQGVVYQIAVDSLSWVLPTGSSWGLAFSVVTPNDDFANASVLSGPSARASVDLAVAFSEPGEPAHGGAPASHSAWWSWMAPESGRVGITAGNSNHTPCRVAVYTGTALAGLTPVATNDPALIPAAAARFYTGESVSFNALAGTTYQLVLDSSNPSDAPFTLELALARAELATPSEGATVMARTNLAFSARVSDLAPTVTQVVYHVVGDAGGEVWTGVAGQVPFRAAWTDTLPGAYTVVTEATDTNGQASLSAPARLFVNLRNDNFAEAVALSGITAGLSGSSIGASAEPGEAVLPGGCGATVWWSWVAPADGWVTLSTATDSFVNLVGAVYVGSSVSNLTLVASHSYGPPMPPPDPRAQWPAPSPLRFRVVAGTTYWIAVDGVNDAQLRIDLRLQMAKAELVEPRDGSTFLAPTNLLVRAEPLDVEGVVKRIDFLEGANVLASVTNRPFEFRWLAPPVGDHVLTARAVDEFGNSNTSPPVSIRVSFDNDDFVNRWVLTGTNLLVVSDNSLASLEPGEAEIGGWPTNWSRPIWSYPPQPGFAAGKSLWWTWVAPADGLLTLDVSADTNRPLVSILSGTALTNLSRVAHNGVLHCYSFGGCAEGARAQAMLLVTNGQVCHIALDEGELVFAGPHQFELRFQPAPDNDNFANRRALAGGSLLVPISNWAATGEPGEPNPKGGLPIRSVWYSWTAPLSGLVTLSSASVPGPRRAGTIPAFDVTIIIGWPNPVNQGWDTPPAPAALSPYFSVFTGEALTNLTVVGAGAQVSFRAIAGVTYLIAMDGQDGTMGEGWMQLNLLSRPANDDFAHATPLAGAAPVFSGHTIGATREPSEPLLDASSEGRSVWWVWTPPVSGTVHIGDVWPFYLGVFVGSAVTDLLPVASGYGGVDVYVHAGTSYHLVVADADGADGSFSATVTGLVSPPSILPGAAVRLPDGRFELQVGGALGQSFVIQASTNLVDWDTLMIDTSLGEEIRFMDEEAVIYPQRFYRIAPLEALAPSIPLRAAVAPVAAGSGFGVRVFGEPGQPFSLRASFDLVHWEELSRNWISGDWVDFWDRDATVLPYRFYQVVPLP